MTAPARRPSVVAMLGLRTVSLVFLVAQTWHCATSRKTGGAFFPVAASHRSADGGRAIGDDGGLADQDAGAAAARAAHAASIAASETTTCARFGDGICCWGDAGGVSIAKPTPVPLPGPPSDIAVLGGSSDQISGCAVVAGEVHCWTYSTDGAPKVEKLAGVDRVVRIVASDGHACALRKDGSVLCWGVDDVGQLGHRSIQGNGPYPPGVVWGLPSAIEIAVGSDHSCARLVSREIECWGNGYGQNTCPGDQACPSATPLAVDLPASATRVSAGGVETCAQVADGTVYCWKLDGRLTVPTAVPSIAGAETVQPGYQLSCAIPPDHRPICWGISGNYLSRVVDHAPIGGFDRIVEYASGWHHACGRTEAGDVVCFGDDSAHQLGDGKTTETPTPQPVTCSTH